MATTTERAPSTLDKALWVAAFGSGLLTLYWSFVQAPPGADSFVGSDKIEHALAYFGTMLFFLLAAVWRPGRGEGRFPRATALVIAGAIAAGAVVEVVQGLTPTRSPELLDWISEIVGALAALAVLNALRRRTAVPGDPA